MFYIQIFGGSFTTVDINPEIKKNYSYLEDENIAFHSSDSVEFIRNTLKSDELVNLILYTLIVLIWI